MAAAVCVYGKVKLMGCWLCADARNCCIILCMISMVFATVDAETPPCCNDAVVWDPPNALFVDRMGTLFTMAAKPPGERNTGCSSPGYAIAFTTAGKADGSSGKLDS